MREAIITSYEDEFGLIRVSVPMAPPLNQVNSYLLPEPDGRFTLVDPGPHTGEAEEAWHGALKKLGLAWDRLAAVVVTHHHPDHYGLAGWMQERTGCKVRMSARAEAEARMSWGGEATLTEALPRLFLRHGMPEALALGVREHLQGFLPQVMPQPEIEPIDAAEAVFMGGRSWRPLITGGHAPGHVSLYEAGSGLILCGDAVLPQISPNVGLQPGSDAQPLQSFMAGLRLLGGLEVSRAFPGHREPFTGFAARTSSLLRHHEERLDDAARLLAGGPLSGFAVCEALFRGRIGSTHQLRFAMSEALAHLAELVRRERAGVVEAARGKVLFTALA